jgi:hypothetical protein
MIGKEIATFEREPGKLVVSRGKVATISNGMAVFAHCLRGIEKPVNGIGPERCFGLGMSRRSRVSLAETMEDVAGKIECWMTFIQEPPGDARYPDPKPRGREWNLPRDQDQPGGYWWLWTRLVRLESGVNHFGMEGWFNLDDPIERQKLAAECRRFVGVLRQWTSLIREMPVAEDALAKEAEHDRRVRISRLIDAIRFDLSIDHEPTLVRLATNLYDEAKKAEAELEANPPPDDEDEVEENVEDEDTSARLGKGWDLLRKGLNEVERQTIAIGEREWAHAVGNEKLRLFLAGAFDQESAKIMAFAVRFGFGPETPPPLPSHQSKPKRKDFPANGKGPGTWQWMLRRVSQPSRWIDFGDVTPWFEGGTEEERQDLAAELARFSGLLNRWAELLREGTSLITTEAEVISPELLLQLSLA